MKRAWRHTCLLTLAGPLALVAQTPNSANVTETIQALLVRIDRLEKRVAELESSAPPSTQQSQAITQSPQPPPGSHDEHLAAAEAAQGAPQSPLLKLSGFSDINFSAVLGIAVI